MAHANNNNAALGLAGLIGVPAAQGQGELDVLQPVPGQIGAPGLGVPHIDNAGPVGGNQPPQGLFYQNLGQGVGAVLQAPLCVPIDFGEDARNDRIALTDFGEALKYNPSA